LKGVLPCITSSKFVQVFHCGEAKVRGIIAIFATFATFALFSAAQGASLFALRSRHGNGTDGTALT
jgi:hypothetical protein